MSRGTTGLTAVLFGSVLVVSLFALSAPGLFVFVGLAVLLIGHLLWGMGSDSGRYPHNQNN